MLSVTRQFEISYSHYLPDYQGDCANVHGHNALVEVEFGASTVDTKSALGVTDRYPMMVCDFKHIKHVVGAIIDDLDHADLNALMTVPTAEAICLWIASEIAVKDEYLARMLMRVRVSETRDSWAEWRRPNDNCAC